VDALRGPRRAGPATALLYGVAAAAVIALHLATSGNLGFHTDELYYLDSGNHPALGYVDFPPIVPLLARLETALLGVTPWSLRLLPCLLSGLLVALFGAYARRLGGSLPVQAVALVVGIASPYLLAANWIFQTVTFDQLTWMVAIYWFLCVVVDGGRRRHWIALGMTLGVGLEVKYTIAGLVVGMVVAVLLTPALRARWRLADPWLAASIALLVWAPNLAWQVVNGFPSLTYITNHGGDISGGGSVASYLEVLGLELALLLPLWVAGLVSLIRSPRLRPIAVCCAVPLVLFLVSGKGYYAAGTIPIVMVQGLVAISRLGGRVRVGLDAAVVVASALQFVLLLQLTVPITPPSRLHATGLDAKSEVFADSVGWDDVASQVTAIYEGLPAADQSDTVIVSRYYGVPGAVQVYGYAGRLPAVVSPQLSDWYWLPPHLTATSALMVDYEPSDVEWMCASVELVGRLTVPYQVSGLEQGAPVTFCRLNAPIPSLWRQLRQFS
jgi:hypothetical protein